MKLRFRFPTVARAGLPLLLFGHVISLSGVSMYAGETKNANSSKPSVEKTMATVKSQSNEKCAECKTMIKSGTVCETCEKKLMAAAVDGKVAVGSDKQMMVMNDMTQASARFVYTLDNDAARNSVAVFRRETDGSLMPLIGSPFNAGGKGLTGGDIDEQGAIRAIGKYVLAVNPGSDTIAVFEKTPRGLLHVEGSPFASNGSTPLSIAVHRNLVYVANQAADFVNPKSLPNVTGFRLTREGKLVAIPNSTMNLPKGMGPAQVEISANGKLLVVTGGFQSDGGDGSRIYTFRVQENGTLTPGANSPIKPDGATGTVGFSISPSSDHVFVSTFKNSGAVSFHVDAETAAIHQKGMPVSNDQRAACWTALAKDGRTLYVGNFVSNSISVYDVNSEGLLTLLGSVPRRGATNKDTKDIELSSDGQYLYAVGSGERQISIFKVESNRLLTELPPGKSPIVLPTGQNITGLLVE